MLRYRWLEGCVVAALEDLPPDVTGVLEASGWSKDRQAPIDEWHRVLGSEGFVLSEVAAEVLRSFGGLRVRPLATGRYSHPLLFDPVLAGSGAYDIAERFEMLFQQRFYPVAEWISNAGVFVGEFGKVGSYDDIEWLEIADTFGAALATMLLGRGAPRVIGEH